MKRLLAIFVVLILTTGARRLFAAEYSVIDLGEGFIPLAINDLGQIVGDRGGRGDRGNESYFWNAGVMTQILHPGGNETRVRDLNNLSAVVGAHRDDVGRDHAFLWSPAYGMVDIEPPEVNYSWANGINDSGVIAGELFGEAAIWQGNGEITKLGNLGGGYSDAMAINSVGQVAGLSSLDASALLQHAFVWQANNMRDLGVVETITKGFQEYALGTSINDRGQVVGIAIGYDNRVIGNETTFTESLEALRHRDPEYGFVWDENIGLQALLPEVHFWGISNAGQVVGEMFVRDPATGPDIWGAAIYENGVLRNLNDLIPPTTEFYLHTATGINERSQIIAYGNSTLPSMDGQIVHGYLLTPVPEPSVGCFLLIGLVFLSRRARVAQRMQLSI